MKYVALLLTLMIVTLSACSPATIVPMATLTPVNTNTPQPSATPVDTSTPQPSATPVNTSTPKPSATPIVTQTPTQLPEDFKNRIIQNYMSLMLVQIEAEILNETAVQVDSGKLQGFESFVTLLFVGGIYKGVSESLPQVVQLDSLKDQWTEVLSIHDKTWNIYLKWLNKEIAAADVIQQMKTPRSDLAESLRKVDASLAKQYGFSQADLTKLRQDTADNLKNAFATKTPASKP